MSFEFHNIINNLFKENLLFMISISGDFGPQEDK